MTDLGLRTPYASWLYAVTSTAPGSQERTAELTKCLQSLPWPNQAMLTLLMNHLQIVEKLSDANKMTASNIGVVFGPTLLRPVDDRDQVDVLADIPHCTATVTSFRARRDGNDSSTSFHAWYALRCVHLLSACWMLMGACDPMVCPMPTFSGAQVVASLIALVSPIDDDTDAEVRHFPAQFLPFPPV